MKDNKRDFYYYYYYSPPCRTRQNTNQVLNWNNEKETWYPMYSRDTALRPCEECPRCGSVSSTLVSSITRITASNRPTASSSGITEESHAWPTYSIKARRTSRLHRRKLVRRLPLWPLRLRVLRITTTHRIVSRFEVALQKKAVVGDVGEADLAAALRKQLAGGLFRTTVNLNPL